MPEYKSEDFMEDEDSVLDILNDTEVGLGDIEYDNYAVNDDTDEYIEPMSRDIKGGSYVFYNFGRICIIIGAVIAGFFIVQSIKGALLNGIGNSTHTSGFMFVCLAALILAVYLIWVKGYIVGQSLVRKIIITIGAYFIICGVNSVYNLFVFHEFDAANFVLMAIGIALVKLARR